MLRHLLFLDGRSRIVSASPLFRHFSTGSESYKARVAIVGSGPSAFYTAKYLLKAGDSISVDMIDRLPTPYGLVRNGVAPDHPEVKNVTNDFDVIASDPRFRFFGNVTVGEHVSVDDLKNNYDGVVLAYGASSDRSIGIPGEDLGNVFSARAFVNWYNGHPDFRNFHPNLDCEDVVIIGQGNVALDCARILVKTPDELSKTDICEHALSALRRSKVRRVHVVGRRGHVQGAFTIAEVRELNNLENADVVVLPEELEKGLTESSMEEIAKARPKKRINDLLTQISCQAHVGTKPKQIILRFLLAPRAILPSESMPEAAGAVEFDVSLLDGAPGAQRPVPTGLKETIRTGMVLKSIGYKTVPLEGVPFDEKSATVKNAGGRVDGVVGLYCTGWCKRGPTGIIGTNIMCAKETASALLEDLANGIISPTEPRKGIDEVLNGNLSTDVVSWSRWQKIDEVEKAAGEAIGKPREKITKVADALKVSNPVKLS